MFKKKPTEAEAPEVGTVEPVAQVVKPPSLEVQMHEKHIEIAGRRRKLLQAQEELDALISQHNRQLKGQ